MLVKATDKYEKLNLIDNVLKRIPKEGEIFEVTEERFKVLTENNRYSEIFVKKLEETKDVETATKKIKSETAVKKIRKVKSIELDLDTGTVKENYDL